MARILSRLLSISLACGFYALEPSAIYAAQSYVQEGFWNLDPYCLESVCACFVLHHDKGSRQRLSQLFPQLKPCELSSLAHCILSSKDPGYVFSEEEIVVMNKLTCPGLIFLCNQEDLPPEKDLARALVLAEFSGETGRVKADHYTRYLDILALRAYVERLRYLDKQSCCIESEAYHKATIEALNTVLFYEEGIRYPSKNEMFADEFSFLSSVADRKFGVCLGVSSLYLSLSQRLYLPLESVTPPGHIYLRYKGGKVNIETTAGGRHLPTSQYCDCLSSEELKLRSEKEIIGLTFSNQGSFALQKQKYEEAEKAYEKAKLYIEDSELDELLGIVKILKGDTKQGEELLRNLPQAKESGSVSYDYLKGNIDLQTLQLLFTYPGTTYDAIVDYQTQLKKALNRSPKCCETRRRLVSVLFHLGKLSEGVRLLEQCVKESPNDYALQLKLCKVLCDRHDYVKAKEYFVRVQKLLEGKVDSKESYTLYHDINKKIILISP